MVSNSPPHSLTMFYWFSERYLNHLLLWMYQQQGLWLWERTWKILAKEKERREKEKWLEFPNKWVVEMCVFRGGRSLRREEGVGGGSRWRNWGACPDPFSTFCLCLFFFSIVYFYFYFASNGVLHIHENFLSNYPLMCHCCCCCCDGNKRPHWHSAGKNRIPILL